MSCTLVGPEGLARGLAHVRGLTSLNLESCANVGDAAVLGLPALPNLVFLEVLRCPGVRPHTVDVLQRRGIAVNSLAARLARGRAAAAAGPM